MAERTAQAFVEGDMVLPIHRAAAIFWVMRKLVSSQCAAICIRRATPADAPAIVGVLQTIAAERVHSAIDVPWSVEEERRYLNSLSAREAIHVAVTELGEIVGLQSLDLWTPTLTSVAHVAQLGTFLLLEWRRRGVGKALFCVTEKFARDAGYSKIVIQVRASNEPAQKFYRRLGFRACGRLKRQVRIDGLEDDEILMEFFL
jgi:ribosomal protein S18 acetylase RimI-like enzyme